MDAVCPLIGLSGERERVKAALERRESVFITGPAGAGKTALIRAAIADLPTASNIIYIRYAASLHRLLVELTHSLYAARHRIWLDRANPDADVDKWLSHQ